MTHNTIASCVLAVKVNDHRALHRVYHREIGETNAAPDGRVGHNDPLEVAHIQCEDDSVRDDRQGTAGVRCHQSINRVHYAPLCQRGWLATMDTLIWMPENLCDHRLVLGLSTQPSCGGTIQLLQLRHLYDRPPAGDRGCSCHRLRLRAGVDELHLRQDWVP